MNGQTDELADRQMEIPNTSSQYQIPLNTFALSLSLQSFTCQKADKLHPDIIINVHILDHVQHIPVLLLLYLEQGLTT